MMRNTTSRHCLSAIGPSSSSGQSSSSSVYNIASTVTIGTPAQCVTVDSHIWWGFCDVRTESNNLNTMRQNGIVTCATPSNKGVPSPPLKTRTQYFLTSPKSYIYKTIKKLNDFEKQK